MPDMPADSIRELLAGLASEHPESSWDRFLRDYSPHILHVAHRYENDASSVTDCYLFVCEKLSDNDFSRLLKFKPVGPAKFSTWLTAVVANLCIDWRRKRYGRRRAVRVVQQLPDLEQDVFHCLYESGMTRTECMHALRHRYGGITDRDIAKINSRIHSLLSSKQRWQLAARKGEEISLSETNPEVQPGNEPTDPGPEVASLVQSEQDRERLAEAMAQLSPDERLILRLRYEQDLTLEEVARLMNFGDPYRARRQIEAAVATLVAYMDL